MSGFSSSIASQSFDEYLTSFDRIRLHVLLSKKCSFWNYRVPWWSKNVLVKLIIFPLIFLPFKMEFMSWPSIKKNFKNNKNTSISIACLKLVLEIISGFGRVRIALIQGFFLSFSIKDGQVPLLFNR